MLSLEKIIVPVNETVLLLWTITTSGKLYIQCFEYSLAVFMPLPITEPAGVLTPEVNSFR